VKRKLILIFLVLVLGVFAAIRILGSKSSDEKSEAADHAGTEHANDEANAEEHADNAHGKEGHVELSPEAIKNADLQIETVSSLKINTTLSVYGKIAANEEAVAHIMPRFPGIVKAVNKRLGDTVQKGEVLAVVESNESLRTYEIRSDIAGTITSKDVTLGELAKGDSPIFVVTDLTTVWVDLNVYRQDFPRLKKGQPVEIDVGDESPPILSTISYLSPFGAESTQTMLARAVIPNPNRDLLPGLFVTAEVRIAEVMAPVAVKLSALQILNDNPVVFVQEGDAFEAREVKLGVRDRENVAIISGLADGDNYVSGNSFILKAELGKHEAAHEH
jgi:cobalt-zinc-cadmium efflux system membrane fusion protein